MARTNTKKNTSEKNTSSKEDTVETLETTVKEVQSQTIKKDNNLKNQYDEIIQLIDDRKKNDLFLKKNLKSFIEKINKQMNKTNKTRRRSEKRRASGFGAEKPLPPEFKKLFNLEEDEIKRTQISKLLHKYLDEHNLKDTKDKRIHRVNDEIKEAFSLTDEQVEYMNNSTSSKDKDGFNFYNVQNFIKLVYDKMNDTTQNRIITEDEKSSVCVVEEKKSSTKKKTGKSRKSTE